MSGMLPPAFDYTKLWFAQVPSAEPLSLEPLQWEPDHVLIGKSWVWRPGTAEARCWILESDTQNLSGQPALDTTKTSEVIEGDTLEEARRNARQAALKFMESAFKRPDANSTWPSLATWQQYGGTYTEHSQS